MNSPVKKMNMKNNQKGFANLVLIGALIILVGAASYFAWSKKAISPVVTQPQVETSDTSNWKTYISDLGYSVNYPADWVVYNGSLRPTQPEILSGMPAQYFEVRAEDQSFEQIRQNNKRNVGGQNLVESAITFAGEKAFAYAEKYSDEFYEILVQHDNKVYSIWTQKYTLPEVKHIFSTFKFTEPTVKIDTSNWKTYKNSQYGLELKYPNNYILTERRAGGTGIGIGISRQLPTCEILDDGDGPPPKNCIFYSLLIQKNNLSGGPIHTATQVLGYSAEKIKSDFETYVQFERDSDWYISYVFYNSEDTVIAESLLNQILSTFKFTEPQQQQNIVDISKCLPSDIKLDDIVADGTNKTLEQRLPELSAECNDGKLFDSYFNREIYFYHVYEYGCWSNPPDWETLQKQQEELNKLSEKYTVVEMKCIPIP